MLEQNTLLPLQDRLKLIRHAFHRQPELGFQEVQTKEKIVQFLQQAGLEVHEGVGVVGVLSCGDSKRMIGIRSDMDALPIHETTGLDYESQTKGVMHACGHDGHMTMLLGAVKILAEEKGFDGTVVFLFQPNEENGLGARAMIDEGVLEQFPLEEIYAIHNLPGAPLGQISTRPGFICNSESLFEFTIVGQGGHASMPQLGVDVILVGSELVQALQSIVARKLAPDTAAVVSVTEFTSDGKRNVLPGRATLKGDVRARSAEDRENIEQFMRQIANGVAMTHNVEIHFSFNTEVVETVNAVLPTNAAIHAAEALSYEVIPDREPMSFTEDFAYFCNAIPGCLLLLGNGEEGMSGRPLHASDYDFNDALLTIGAKFWTQLVRDRLPQNI